MFRRYLRFGPSKAPVIPLVCCTLRSARYTLHRTMIELTVLRDISLDVFNRPYQLEVAQAASQHQEAFAAGEVIDRVRERARDAGAVPPGESAARKNLQKLATLRVLRHVQDPAVGHADMWKREPSLFWDWLEELEKQVQT